MELSESEKYAIVGAILETSITYDELGMTYDELKQIVYKKSRESTYRRLEAIYKKEIELKKKYEKFSVEELQEILEEKETEILYLKVYKDVIDKTEIRLDYEKFRKSVPKEQLNDFVDRILSANVTVRSKKHPCYSLVVDSKSRRDWDKIPVEKIGEKTLGAPTIAKYNADKVEEENNEKDPNKVEELE